jgi:hypothetical protein
MVGAYLGSSHGYKILYTTGIPSVKPKAKLEEIIGNR